MVNQKLNTDHHAKPQVSYQLIACSPSINILNLTNRISNWPKILDLSEQCLALQKGILHPYHHLVVETLHYAMDACIHLEKWEQALEHGLRSIEHIE